MSVVSINRFKEKDQQEVLDFIADKKYIVLSFDDDEGVDIISNFLPGLLETTLLHTAYLFAADLIMNGE
jgi:hypothetical protein